MAEFKSPLAAVTLIRPVSTPLSGLPTVVTTTSPPPSAAIIVAHVKTEGVLEDFRTGRLDEAAMLGHIPDGRIADGDDIADAVMFLCSEQARHILGLESLRRTDETNDARDRGILYHAALHGFFQVHPGALPKDAAAELVRLLDKAAQDLGFNLENAPFWRPRFARFADWFAETEAARRADVRMPKSEVGGKLKVDAPAGPFEITARADRIDMLRDGSVRIYDFKTSANTAGRCCCRLRAGKPASRFSVTVTVPSAPVFCSGPANWLNGIAAA